MDNFFRPGDTCQSSGVYEVVHDGHESRHRELTVVRGEPFPPCRQCLSVQYRLVRAATHVAQGIDRLSEDHRRPVEHAGPLV